MNSVREIASALLSKPLGTQVSVTGWIKWIRKQKANTFLHITDGSTSDPLQIFVPSNLLNQKLTNGSSVQIEGILQNCPVKLNEKEIAASSIKILGYCNSEEYPLQKKKVNLEYLRSYPEIKCRSTIFANVAKARSLSHFLLFKFMLDKQFFYVQTPIITGVDCEGAGEQFRVCTGSDKDMSFFKKPAFLTVSGQLHLEVYCASLRNVFNFGPVFRAEAHCSTRHLSEFWMLEAEMAFIDSIYPLMKILEESIKHTAYCILKDHSDAILKISENVAHIEKLMKPFNVITYSEVIQIIQNSDEEMKDILNWGDDLNRDVEKYICHQHFDGVPVFIIDYPKSLKPFYMRENSDGNTVACFDLIFPNVGELAGGSLREERHDKLMANIRLKKLDPKKIDWYINLRNFGIGPHGGYGLGFDRFIQYICNFNNIKDTVLAARTDGNCEF